MQASPSATNYLGNFAWTGKNVVPGLPRKTFCYTFLRLFSNRTGIYPAQTVFAASANDGHKQCIVNTMSRIKKLNGRMVKDANANPSKTLTFQKSTDAE